jgi:hypothetical protein
VSSQGPSSGHQLTVVVVDYVYKIPNHSHILCAAEVCATVEAQMPTVQLVNEFNFSTHFSHHFSD